MPFAYNAVLNGRFYYYSGTVRPTGQETTASGKTVCHSQLPRKEGISHVQRSFSWGST